MALCCESHVSITILCYSFSESPAFSQSHYKKNLILRKEKCFRLNFVLSSENVLVTVIFFDSQCLYKTLHQFNETRV